MATSRLVSSPRLYKLTRLDAPTPRIDYGRVTRALEYAGLALLLLFALALPLSGKATQHLYRAFVVLWLVKFAFERRKPRPQALAWPMLAFLCLSGISTALSPTPIYSWDRMKIVGLMIIAVVVGDSIRKLWHMKAIVAVLLAATAISAGVTAWQYAAGYGVKVVGNSTLAQAGLQPGDIIQALDRRGVRTPDALRAAISRMPADAVSNVAIVRGPLSEHLVMKFDAQTMQHVAAAQLRRGRPNRAEGYFKHWAIYAEVMLQLGLIAWGLLLTRRRRGGMLRWLLGGVYVCALLTVAATQTRSALAAMLIGCFFVLLFIGSWRQRAIGIGVLIAIFVVATIWIQHTRGMGWINLRDDGSVYRVLMWQDALRLIPQHPWFGIGMESIRQYWREWDIRAWRIYGFHWHFHSTYLQIAVERGLPALAAWLWLVGAYLVFLWKLLGRARRAADWFSQGLVLGALGGFIAFLITGVVQYNLGEEQISAVLWFVAGLTLALHSILHARAELQLVSSSEERTQARGEMRRAA